MKNQKDKVRHILALSGGKDSSALAVYLKDKIPNLEYAFCDTGEELDETYTYIHRLQDQLNIDVTWLKSERNFEYYLDMYNGVLPDANTRWCTRMLKIKPYEKYIGDDQTISYVGIRADEFHRRGYEPTKPNIKSEFPFIKNRIYRDDVIRILEEAGLGLPDYYTWRSRSGCYFCFFQQKIEWVGLRKYHNDLFEKAKKFEKFNPETGEHYTWMENESLKALEDSRRRDEIREKYKKRQIQIQKKFKGNQKLMDILTPDDDLCPICHL
ncbi:conserved hypothetical protein [Candidatus Desulfarcum epimagneticum]|uniref:Phosphoadenosine phosphosulphate reductase domain-containing protein n=1 Tax=uncultured Desulfobacteraceae bacterium TaxID=218296 RepID=A0A484HK85_9BACT|nr:conserved hypothetical protein [uncultured Desulfobacteraceae bacterium]